jgi:hypothetical protein
LAVANRFLAPPSSAEKLEAPTVQKAEEVKGEPADKIVKSDQEQMT